MLDRYLGLLNGDYGRRPQVATWLAHVLLACALVWPLASSVLHLGPHEPEAPKVERHAPATPKLSVRESAHRAGAVPTRPGARRSAPRRVRPAHEARPRPTSPAPAPSPRPASPSPGGPSPQPRPQAEAHVDAPPVKATVEASPPRVAVHVDTPPAKVDAQVDKGGARVGAQVQTPAGSADVKATVELPDLGQLPGESDAGRTVPVGVGVAVEADPGRTDDDTEGVHVVAHLDAP